MKRDVLFITEKWCDGNPDTGLTNHFHNMFGSLSRLGIVDSITLAHYDEIFRDHNCHFDQFVDVILEEYKPNIIVTCHMGDSPLNPTRESYKSFQKSGAKVVVAWPDTRDWVFDIINRLDPFVDLHVSWCSEGEDEKPINKNHMWLWSPEDDDLYYDDGKEKTIDVSFIGSLCGYNNIRQNYINYLIDHNISIFTNGGLREKKLTPKEYADFIRNSKISVNFSMSGKVSTYQCKGRVFESIACNSFLLEMANECTPRRFTPGEHYAEFTSPEDLKNKIEYYLNHEEERKIIAKKAYDVYQEKYTAKHYWQTIFDRIQI